MQLHNIRCEQCGTLLCKENIEIGDIEIKCYRCDRMNFFAYESKIVESLFTATLI